MLEYCVIEYPYAYTLKLVMALVVAVKPAEIPTEFLVAEVLVNRFGFAVV